MNPNPYIKTKVSVMDSIRSIPVGIAVTFNCTELCSYSTAQSAVSRLNAISPNSYSISSADYGRSFTINRIK